MGRTPVGNKPLETNITFGISRKSLEAIKIFACKNCEAPGIYKNDPRTAQNWPGCFDPSRNNQPVGATCPNCGKSRGSDQNLGELTASMPRWIWHIITGFKWCLVKSINFAKGRA
jgi:hypothetical protein